MYKEPAQGSISSQTWEDQINRLPWRCYWRRFFILSMISGGHTFIGRSLTSGMQSLSISCLLVCDGYWYCISLSPHPHPQSFHSLHMILLPLGARNGKLPLWLLFIAILMFDDCRATFLWFLCWRSSGFTGLAGRTGSSRRVIKNKPDWVKLYLWMRLYQLWRSHLEAAPCSIPGAKWAF